jgi:protein tyrosine/serine phosphatase
MRYIAFSLVFVLLLGGCSTKEPQITPRKSSWAQPVKQLSLKNFHKVDRKVYRSAQPNKEEFKELENFGIRYDLNLRKFHDDTKKLEGRSIHYYNIPITTSMMSYEQLVEAVAYLVHTKGKTLVHCHHGSDRTGTVVAGYRIAAEGWSKEDAIDEFVHGGYGYHKIFINLPKLLLSLDLNRFKNDVKNYTFKDLP